MKRILLLVATCWLCLLQVPAASIMDYMSGQGMEDFRVDIADSVVYASVEPTAYRGTYRGAAVALLALGQYYPDMKYFELVVTEYQLPQVAIHANREAGLWQVCVDYTISPILKHLKSRPQHNSSAWRFDLTVNPIISLDNHRFDVLYEYTVSIAPTIETTLWPGNRITLMPVFPIASNVFKSKPEGYIHVGIAAIQQDVFISNRLRAQLSGGMFLGQLMGFNAVLTYRAGNAITFGLKAALLGDAYVEADKYHFGILDKVSVLGQASYYHTPTQIEAGLTGGRFVFGDYGARLDLTRHYGDYAIGVFGILTGGEYNAGFHFAIPVGGKCQKRKGNFRIMLPEFYDMEYNMESYFGYAEKKMGRQVETRPDVNHAAHYWQASYVEMYLRKYIQSNHQ